MFSIFQYLHKDIDEIQDINKLLEDKSTSKDRDFIFQLKLQLDNSIEKFKSINEFYLVFIIFGFLLGLVVNQFFSTKINIMFAPVEIMLFINMIFLLLFSNEILKMLNYYDYNQILIYFSILIISLLAPLHYTISSGCIIRWFDYFQFSYLLVSLLFVALINEVINFIENIKVLLGYLPPKGGVNNGIGGL